MRGKGGESLKWGAWPTWIPSAPPLRTILIIHCVSKNIPDIFDCNLKTN